MANDINQLPPPKRRRTKVNRACDNCRRRKIKCTGTKPCANCFSYQCPCIYSEKDSPNASISNNSINDNINDNGTPPSHNNPEGVLACFVPSLRGTSTGPSSNTSEYATTSMHSRNEIFSSPASPTMASNDSLMVPVDSSRDSSAVPVPQEDKSSTETLLKNGIFENDIEDIPNYTEFHNALMELQAIPKKNKVVQYMIDSLTQKIDSLRESWEPTVNLKRLPNLLQRLDKRCAAKSIETQLMRNKYRDRMYLTRFGFWTCNNNNNNNNKKRGSPSETAEGNAATRKTYNSFQFVAETGFLNRSPVVDEIFGLYSPLDILSLRGIGHLIQRYIYKVSQDKRQVSQLMKSNIYLLLRFFDMLCLHLTEGCISIASPLETYLLRSSNLSPMAMVSSGGNSNDARTPSLSSITSPQLVSSLPSPKSASNREMVVRIIEGLSKQSLESSTGVSVDQLLNTMNDDPVMLVTLLEAIRNHKATFEDFFLEVEEEEEKEDTTRLETFNNLVEVQDSLLALSYAYYNSTLYHLDGYGSVDYLEQMLNLLDVQSWIGELYGFQKVLSVSLNCALEIGLSRWEYYVGMDEVSAEKRRRIWWRLYYHDKASMLLNSYTPKIEDSKMNCLLPREFIDLGFLDHRDFIERVHMLPARNETLDRMSTESLVFYANCAAIQVFGNFYSEVLYSEVYTSVKNNAKPPSLRLQLTLSLFERLAETRTKLDKIKEQASRLFELAAGNSSETATDSTEGVRLKRHTHEAVKYVLMHNYIHCLLLRSVTNLTVRLNSTSLPETIKKTLSGFSEETYRIWTEMNKLIINLEPNYDVWSYLKYYPIIYLFMMAWIYDGKYYTEFSDLIDVVHIVDRMRKLTRLFNDKKTTHVATLFREFSRAFSLVCLFTRILMTSYIIRENLTTELLLKRFEREVNAKIFDLVRDILDHSSCLYRYLLEPVEKSGFHLNIQQMWEADYNIPYSEGVTNANTSMNSTLRQPSTGSRTGETVVYPNIRLAPSQTMAPSVSGSTPTSVRSPQTLRMNSFSSPEGHPMTLPPLRRFTETGTGTEERGSEPLTDPRLAFVKVDIPGQAFNNRGTQTQLPVPVPSSVQAQPPIFGNLPIPSKGGNPPVPNQVPIERPPETTSNTTLHPSTTMSSTYSSPSVSSSSNTTSVAPNLYKGLENFEAGGTYNLGTLEEFVTNTDLVDLYNALWNSEPYSNML